VKPAAFEYRRPETIEDVVALLAEHGDEAKVLAGGQSLVPMMNFRLAAPAVVIDIGAVSGLDALTWDDDHLTIGAQVRHHRLEQPGFGGPLGSLFSTAARHVGHWPIRLRGTFGGSIAHADPAAEWCLLAALLDVEAVVRSASGQRAIKACDLFETFLTTTIGDDELLTEIRVPWLTEDWVTGFSEFSRRAGDFAVVAVGTALRLDGGRVAEARIAAGGVATTPVRLSRAEAALIGQPLDAASVDQAAAAGATEVEPGADIHGSTEYRRDLVRSLTRRALLP
jgi:carbon-monoxide dehydrogenase medium subunit